MLTTADIATQLDVTPTLVRSAIRRGDLQAVRHGNSLQVSPLAFAEWVASCRIIPTRRFQRDSTYVRR